MVADNNKPVAEEAGDAVEKVTPEVQEEELNDEPELSKEEKIAEMDKHMKKGNRAYILKDFETATDEFSKATEYSVSVYGEFAPETFEPHFQYGRSLVEMVFLEGDNAQNQLDGLQDYLSKKMEERKEKLGIASTDMNDSAVGNPDDVPEEERKEVIEAVDKALEENAAELEALVEKKEDEAAAVDAEKESPEKVVTEETKTDTSAKGNSESVVEQTNGDTTTAEDNDIEGTEEEQQEDDDEEDEPELTTAELAWEILEVSSKICEKQEVNQEWDIKKSEVLYYIGQLSAVEEKYEEALESYLAAIELRRKYFPDCDRTIASHLFEVAEVWKLRDDFTRAAEFYRQAENTLNNFITESEKQLDGLSDEEKKKLTDEIKDVKEMLPEISSKINDATESAKSIEEKNKEMSKTESPEKNKPSDDENMEPAAEFTNFQSKKRKATDASPIDEAKKPKSESDVEEPVVTAN